MKTGIFILSLMAVILQSCKYESNAAKTDSPISKDISVNSFTGISVEGSHNVHFVQGNKTSVKITGCEDDIKRMRIYTNGNTLHITEKSNNISIFSLINNRHEPVDVYIVSPNLRGVSILGSGYFCSNSDIDTDHIDLKISGSGDIKMKNIICDRSKLDVAGSGDIEIDGLTTSQSSICIPGSGSISISNSSINNVTGEIIGSGSILLENANIGYACSKITGSGDIEIQGNVKKHTEQIIGSGSVNIR